MKKCPHCQTEVQPDDKFCYVCGARIPEQIVQNQSSVSSQSAPPSTSINTEQPPSSAPSKSTEPSPSISSTQIPAPPTAAPTHQPQYHSQVPQQQWQPTSKPPKKNIGLKIFLTLVLIIVVAAGIMSVLIYTGHISKQQLSFIPQSVLDIIPVSSQSHTTSAQASTFYVAFSMTIINNQKTAVVTTIFNNTHTQSSSRDAAELYYRNQAKNQIPNFLLYKNHFIYAFSKFGDALDKREEIIRDLQGKGYQLQFIEIK